MQLRQDHPMWDEPQYQDGNETECWSESPDGFVCTRPEHEDTVHIGRGLDGEVCDAWT